MNKLTRREFLAAAASIGAVAALARSGVAKSHMLWTERRDAYPEGVAVGLEEYQSA